MLAEADRPREKLMLKGRSALSDAELIAILLQTGTRNRSALDIAHDILRACDDDLTALGRLDLNALEKFDGIGSAKAVTLISALELGLRRAHWEGRNKKKVQGSKEAFDALYPDFADLDHEQFWVLYLGNSGRILGKKCISKGGITGTVADVRIIMRYALEFRATGIILAHNHPSGTLKASEADIRLTKRIRESSKIMDVNLLDHLVIGDRAYLSFADDGLLE